MSFSLCLNTSTIRPTPLLEKLLIASACGYAGIELWHSEIEETLERKGITLSELKQRIADLGLSVPSTINLKGWFEATDRQDPAWEMCRKRMDHAAELGAEFIVAGPPQYSANWEQGVANYGYLLGLGEQRGIRPAMEFLGFVEQIFTLEQALQITRDVGIPGGTIVVDPFHIFRGGGAFSAVRELRPETIAVCHFNDARSRPPLDRQTDRDRVMPGLGELPLVALLGDLLAIGYAGTLSLELFSEELWKRDPSEVAEEGIRRMRDLIAQSSDRLSERLAE